MENTRKDKIDCMKCVHYYVTWEPRTPKACRLFGFKSRYMPASVVRQSTGSACKGFERKNTSRER